jgi:hypothetical protein
MLHDPIFLKCVVWLDERRKLKWWQRLGEGSRQKLTLLSGGPVYQSGVTRN